MSPDDPRHGTKAGASQHYRDREPMCDPCRHADRIYQRRYSKRRIMGHNPKATLGQTRYNRIHELRQLGASWQQLREWTGVARIGHIYRDGPDATISTRTAQRIDTMRTGRIVTPVGVTRRIRALGAVGYSAQRIADATGLDRKTIKALRARVHPSVRGTVREIVADAYEELAMRPQMGGARYDRAVSTRLRRKAQLLGWEPPLAWDDIDHDPDIVRGTVKRPKGRPTRMPDVLEDFDWLTSQGLSPHEASERVGVALGTIDIYRARMQKLEVA